MISFLIVAFVFISQTAFAIPFSIGETSIFFESPLVLNQGSFISFPDGTTQYSATVQGIQGVKGDKGDSSPITLLSSSSITSDLSDNWYTDYTWSDLASVSFATSSPFSRIKIDSSINVGIYDLNWCSLGIFVDNSYSPSCVYSWTGNINVTSYNTYNFSCLIQPLPFGVHTYTLKHRSQYCHYFNAPEPDDISNFIYFWEIPQ